MLSVASPILRLSALSSVGTLWRPLVSRCLSTASPRTSYSVKTEGHTLSEKYRVFLTDPAKGVVSPWHDVGSLHACTKLCGGC